MSDQVLSIDAYFITYGLNAVIVLLQRHQHRQVHRPIGVDSGMGRSDEKYQVQATADY